MAKVYYCEKCGFVVTVSNQCQTQVFSCGTCHVPMKLIPSKVVEKLRDNNGE